MMLPPYLSRPMRKPWFAVPTVIFLGISLLLLLLPIESHLVPDSNSYIKPARQLADGLIPEFRYRLPGYPMGLAFSLWVSGGLKWALAGQVLAYLGIAAMGQALFRRLRAHVPSHAFALMLLFPSFVYAQLIVPDVFFMGLMLGGILAAVMAHQDHRPGMALLAGVAFALAATLRSNAPFLGWALLAGWLAWMGLQRSQSGSAPGARRIVPRAALMAALAAGPFLIALLAMMTLNWSQGVGFHYMNPEYRRYTMHDHIIYAEFLSEPQTFEQARVKVYRRTREFESMSEERWEALPATEKHGLVLDNTARNLFGLGPGTLLKVVTLAETRMLISNAQREWLELVGIPALNMREAFMVDRVREAPLAAIIMHGLFALGFLVRLLAFVGLWRVVRERDYGFLVFTLVPIFAIFFTSGFIGYSRYRLPVEPFLLMYTTLGIEWLLARLNRGKGAAAG